MLARAGGAKRICSVGLGETQSAPGQALDVGHLGEGARLVEGRVAPAEVAGENEGQRVISTPSRRWSSASFAADVLMTARS
jgi:hypothetical protein